MNSGDVDLGQIEVMLALALTKAGGVKPLARALGVHERYIYKWKRREHRKHSKRTLLDFYHRLHAFLQGDDIQSREERIARYERNVEARLPLWDEERSWSA